LPEAIASFTFASSTPALAASGERPSTSGTCCFE
jgi:hypothetical protein